MSLADKPINVVRGANNVPFDTSDREGLMPRLECGMTILEHASVEAMKGLLAGRPHLEGKATIDPSIIHSYAEFAVYSAKALIAELEKVNP